MVQEKKKTSSKHVEIDANVERDELALLLQKELNKQFSRYE